MLEGSIQFLVYSPIGLTNLRIKFCLIHLTVKEKSDGEERVKRGSVEIKEGGREGMKSNKRLALLHTSHRLSCTDLVTMHPVI